MTLSRRHFLSGSLGSAVLLGAAAACGSGDTGVGGGGGAATTGAAGSAAAPSAAVGGKVGGGPVTGNISFAFWGGSVAEQTGFEYAKKIFETENPGATVELKTSPYDGFYSGVDRSIQAGDAPDVFRVDYTTFGRYASRNVLLDLNPYYDQSEIDAFIPSFWQAISYNGGAYGVPHQTDTSAIIYDVAALEKAGVSSVPTTLETAWTWDEFADVMGKLRSSLPDNQFPFAYNWTQAGAYRWLSFLYQAGGSLLTPDLAAAAIPSDAGTKALDFTKSFFTEKWVPDTNTIQGTRYSDDFFLKQTTVMSSIGDFSIPAVADPAQGFKGEWGATFLPRDAGAASDLGGNAIAVYNKTEQADTAAAFAKLMGREDVMKYFCAQSMELPTLSSLAAGGIDFVYVPELMSVFTQQATTVSQSVVDATVTPAFNDINTTLQAQLETAFKGGDTASALEQMAAGVNSALGA
ncbi:sugar ABC transporter substrate-binding protein [Nakamurella flavida]|uniref:Sugar ABC transporter substrate-binding protein n=1 Tax=Nakamurella flavida TaxID=363630 RepID=A0A938YDB9_9ACTN|nr:sugar ABC transporter substrate-binding protein [Nakamurella flavida]MBM9475580.1 sugar ABC transporter substrate-binding protein [Nakamurella flavida]MDP9778144.1 multiple sugar transport system substrate-binding protein [Nakamurella flavida]